jgi:N-acylneuraminate cytidylyltransferase
MIAYSIEAAQAAMCFDRIVVSTDDREIADIAEAYGAEVPFLRPHDVSDDFSTTIQVIQHAIKELCLTEQDNICCIYATAPFIEVDKLLTGLKLLQENQLDYAYSATEFSFPIQRAFYLTEQGKVEMFSPEHFTTRSQDLIKAYHDAGQFYWGSFQAYKQGTPFFSENTMPVLLDITKVQDIDTPSDWNRAELIYNFIFDQ